MTDERAIERFQGFLGLNTVDDPTTIGANYLQVAENVDNHIDGRLIMRPGQTSIHDDSCHSAWSNKDKTIALYMQGTNLMRLNVNESSDVVASGFTAGARMSYAEGMGGMIYCTNFHEVGMVKAGAYLSLSDPSIYDGRIMPKLDFGKAPPLAGQLIEYWHGRLFICRGDLVFYSDSYKPWQFDLRHNIFKFSGHVTLFRGVDGGIFISDGKTRFRPCDDIKAPTGPEVIKSDYAATLGTDIFIKSEIVKPSGLGPMDGMTLWWRSREGICIGSNGGQYRNVTVKKYAISRGEFGSGFFMNQNGVNKYVTTLAP